MPENSILETCDIEGAYQNIPQEDGLKCLVEVLKERQDKVVPTNFIVKLMDLVQSHHIFEFHDGMLWRQLWVWQWKFTQHPHSPKYS